jgi:hypothetical protein
MVCETLPQKNPSQKRAGGVAYSVGPEFKPQYHKKKKKTKMRLGHARIGKEKEEAKFSSTQ